MGASTAFMEAFKAVVEARLNEMRTTALVRVTSVDMVKQRVNLQLVVRQSYRGEDGQAVVYKPKQLVHVPIRFESSFGGSMATTIDINVGDFGTVLFLERSLDEWKAEGNGDITPADKRRFNVADTVFLPGVVPFNQPLPEEAWAPGARVFWGSDNRIGSRSATDPFVLTSMLIVRLNNLENAHNTHTHDSDLATGSGVQSTTPQTSGGPSDTVVVTQEVDIAATKAFGE